jgi:hypothetical protein
VTDPRFLRWLAVTEEALSAPVDQRAEAVVAACNQREELRRSLLEDPPKAAPDGETAGRLTAAEAALAEAAVSERERISAALQEVRNQRKRAAGYRPLHPHPPAFVSRKA